VGAKMRRIIRYFMILFCSLKDFQGYLPKIVIDSSLIVLVFSGNRDPFVSSGVVSGGSGLFSQIWLILCFRPQKYQYHFIQFI
jgi:hypothetical protein